MRHDAGVRGYLPVMGDAPWPGDACSLVDAFRRGERSPVEELEAVYAAIDASPLNAFCHLDREHATLAAGRGRRVAAVRRRADRRQGARRRSPGGRTPTPRCRSPTDIATGDVDEVQRIRDLGGAVLAGQTTASEFGGVNVTRTVLHGTTHNPWQLGPHAGRLVRRLGGGRRRRPVTLATGGDGGGSIRIPAGFCGLVGLKAHVRADPAVARRRRTATSRSSIGCLARSVRDTARWFDVANGHDPRDPLSLPRVEGWEAGLGTLDRRAARAAGRRRRRLGRRRRVAGDVGRARSAAADDLIADAGLRARRRRRHRRCRGWAGRGRSAA